MKYKTPRYNTDQINRDFIASLPDEFEIVEPGMTQVRWPMILTKEKLMELGSVPEIGCKAELRGAALLALAAIAPEEKKLKVALWRTKVGGEFQHYYLPKSIDWLPNDPSGWRKVGECEVDA